MSSLDLVIIFILSFLDSICTIYISSYSMENINQLFVYVNLYIYYQFPPPSLKYLFDFFLLGLWKYLNNMICFLFYFSVS